MNLNILAAYLILYILVTTTIKSLSMCIDALSHFKPFQYKPSYWKTPFSCYTDKVLFSTVTFYYDYDLEIFKVDSILSY